MKLKTLSDAQLLRLSSNPDFIRAGGKCPTCRGTGKYKFEGEEHVCPENEFGQHEQDLLFKEYCLHNVPLEFQQLDWDAFPYSDRKAEFDNYVDNFETIRFSGIGWEIYGAQKGVGKTFGATGILKELVKAGFDGWFAVFADVKNYHELTDGFRRDYLVGKLRNSEILVLDEVLQPYGSEKQRYFYEDKLEEIIRHRTTHNLPTIITTNMVEEEMYEFFPRVYSLFSAKQQRVELTGDDFRIKEAFWEKKGIIHFGEVRPIS